MSRVLLLKFIQGSFCSINLTIISVLACNALRFKIIVVFSCLVWFFYFFSYDFERSANESASNAWVLECLTAWVRECPSTCVHKCPSALSARVPKLPSSAWVPQVLECQSVQLSWVPECPSVLRVPECSSALRVPLECLWSVLGVLFQCPISLSVLFE